MSTDPHLRHSPGSEFSADSGRLPRPSRVLDFGGFAFHVEGRDLYKGRHRVRISASQLRLLTLFLERPDQMIGRDQIRRCLWNDSSTIDVERGINTAVNGLRKALGDSAAEPRFLETAIGLGYRFVMPVKERVVAAASPSSADAPPEPVGASTPEPVATEVATRSSPASAVDSPPDVWRNRGSAAARGLIWTTATATALLVLALGWGWLHRMPPKVAGYVGTRPSGFHPVTFDDGDSDVTAAAVSPDGGSVAYADALGISVHRFDGSADVAWRSEHGQLVEHMAWLPNGSTLLVSTAAARGGSQIWLIDKDNYHALDLTDAGNAEPSPNGSAVAFTRRGGRELWTATVYGDNPRLLPALAADESLRFVFWSRDGRCLLLSGFHSGGPVRGVQGAGRWFYRSVEASTGRVLAERSDIEIDSGFLAPGGVLHFVSGATSAGIVDKTHTAEMQVTTDPATGAFVGEPSLDDEIYGHPALGLSASRDGSTESAVLLGAVLNVYVAELADGGRLLKDGRPLTHLTFDAYPHGWTADGGVLYETVVGGKTAIFRQVTANRKPQSVALLPFDLFYPEPSPDGRWILFMAREPDGRSVYRVPVGGGSPERITRPGEVEEFHCPRPGASPCVASRPLGRSAIAFFALDPLSGLGRQIARLPWRQTYLGMWSLSPDGTDLAVADDSYVRPGVDLLPVEARDASPRRVALPGYGAVLEATWSADAKALYVECRDASGYTLAYQPLEGGSGNGRAEVLARSADTLYAVPSPDGRMAAYPWPRIKTRVWIKGAQPRPRARAVPVHS